jgi:LAGLIDADG endonuclease
MGVIVEQFDKYPLITQKLADYKLFKEAYMFILNKEHMTLEGLKKLVSIKALVNKGLTEQLKEAFSDVVPVTRKNIINSEIPNPD